MAYIRPASIWQRAKRCPGTYWRQSFPRGWKISPGDCWKSGRQASLSLCQGIADCPACPESRKSAQEMWRPCRKTSPRSWRACRGPLALERLQELDQRRAIIGGHVAEFFLRLFRLASVPEDCLAQVARASVMQVNFPARDAGRP